MSKPFRDSSAGVGLDVVVTLPARVVELIEAQAKERGETVSGWCRAELIAAVEVECASEVPPDELAFDVRQAIAGRLLASRGSSGAGLRLNAADLRGVADEEVVDVLRRSEDETDFRARLARLRKAARAREADGA